jgi:hypothetical protein
MPKFMSIDEYFDSLAEPLQEICRRLEPIIDAALPDAKKALWHGDAVWSLGPAPGKAAVCLVKAYSSYVTFGFWRGQALTDESGRLEAGSRTMASVKLRTVADIDKKLFTGWLRQARELELAELPK